MAISSVERSWGPRNFMVETQEERRGVGAVRKNPIPNKYERPPCHCAPRAGPFGEGDGLRVIELVTLVVRNPSSSVILPPSRFGLTDCHVTR